jgi:predicted  nucleic acid-binding Zn-ribbon protein
MSMSGKLDSVVALYKIQTDLAAAQTRLDGIPDWMVELHEEHSQRQGGIDEVAAARDTSAQERRSAEGLLSEAQEKSKRYQEQLRQVTSEREYTAMLKEIDTVKTQINDYEQQALTAIEKHDEAEKSLVELQEAFRELDERYQVELKKWESEKPAVAKKVKKFTRESTNLRETLPRQIVSLFDRISKRYDGQAVARVLRITTRGANAMWHCEECSYNVRPQVVIDLRNDSVIIQCDSCKRFLYYEEE